jgi:anti-sigma factor RsiW
VHKVARWVMDQYEVHSRMSAITDEELEEQVKQSMPDQYAARVKKAS